MRQPAYLKTGDRVGLAAPARAVSPDEMAPAIAMLRSWGLEVVEPDGLYDRCGQLAGTDGHRAALMQSLLDDPTISAVVCCRGGYGSVRIVDRLDLTRFAQHPKWIVGYSDITVLHSHISATLGLPTLHATMPINFPAGLEPCPATESLRQALFGEPADICWQLPDAEPLAALAGGEGPSPHSAAGLELRGVEVVGGNLSILYSLLGSRSQVDTRGRVLLIEDLDEYLYHIDRMMQALGRAGMLDGAAALMVGGMNDMHDNATSFGPTAMQIVAEAAAKHRLPLLAGAPFGHIGQDNMALPLGQKLNISVSNSKKCRIFAP